jgi:transketolase N-terminal domain/subunit
LLSTHVVSSFSLFEARKESPLTVDTQRPPVRPLPETDAALTWRSINTIRTLAMDAVQAAESGHPGTPMALAPAGWLLWTRHLHQDPRHPDWPDRDRFVLSCGHASMLLYGLLHLTGYDLPLEEIKNFRQWGSKTPGHPEHGHTPGVETTTGPLGQGFGNAVGMAMAEQLVAERFNRPGYEIVNHRTWVFASDGDLMEGVSGEAASLAGHLALGKLTVLYDDNHITIDGGTDRSFSEEVKLRFVGYGWRVLEVSDGNDLEAIDRAFTEAASHSDRPTLIRLRTIIGYPAPTRQNTAKAHGEALGAEEVRKTKEILGWPIDEPFHVPADVAAQIETLAQARQLSRRVSRPGSRIRRRPGRPAFGQLGRRASQVSRGDRAGNPAGLGGRPAGAGHHSADPRRRLRRPRGKHGNQSQRAGPFRTGQARTRHRVGDSRARHGLGDERDGAARRHSPVRRDLPGLFRLHEAGDSSGRADEAADDLHLHP